VHRPQFHPLGAVSALSFVAAVAFPFLGFGLPLSSPSLLAIGLLASPFLVLLLGHVLAANSLRGNTVLATSNLLLWFAWLFAATAMWYFQAGWYGIAIFVPVLVALAGLCLFVSHQVKEPEIRDA